MVTVDVGLEDTALTIIGRNVELLGIDGLLASPAVSYATSRVTGANG